MDRGWKEGIGDEDEEYTILKEEGHIQRTGWEESGDGGRKEGIRKYEEEKKRKEKEKSRR